MRNPCRAGTLAGALCLLAALSTGAQPRDPAVAAPSVVEVTGKRGPVSAWFRAESQRFVVFSDAREEDVEQLLDNLEKLDHVLRTYTRPVGRAEPQGHKLTLYYPSRVSDLGAIDTTAPADAVGLYSSCAAGVHGFGLHLERIPRLGDKQLDDSPLDKTLSAVFEAYTRHFLYRHTDIRTPTSFIDGFAQYFSSVRFSDRQMVVGRMPVPLARYLNLLEDGGAYSLDDDDVLQHRLADARNPGGAAGVRLEYEAKTWRLTHYMLSTQDQRRRLNRYLGLVGRGVAVPTAFERAFGLKTTDLGRVLGRYGRLGMQALRVDFPSLPAAQVRVRALPLAAGEFVLADAALKSCPGPQAGVVLLDRLSALAARFPDDALAGLALSRAQIDWGDPQAALPRLEAILRDDDADHEARHLLGLANLRLALRSEGDVRRARLQAAQHHLRQARGSKPPSSEAALALFGAEVAAADEPDTATLEDVVAAWRSAREVDALARCAALARAYAGHADEAHRMLGSLAQDARHEPLARWAKQWQNRLEAGVSRSDILAEMRRLSVTDAPSREWTLDKDSVLQKVALNAGLERAQPFVRDGRAGDAAGRAEHDPRGGTGPR